MDQFSLVLNEMLVEVYHNIMRMEELSLKQAGNLELSISEIHLIECVGRGMPEGKTIRELARELNIKSPSVTVAVKKLEGKGYVKKVACVKDGRSVRVQLTHDGLRINAYHSYYHRMMIKNLSNDMSNEEKQVLLHAVVKLNTYFLESIGEMK